MDKPSTKRSSARDDRHHKDRHRDSSDGHHLSSRDDRNRHYHRHSERDSEEHRRSSRRREKSEEGREKFYDPPHEERESRREKRKERERSEEEWSGRVAVEDGDRKERRRRFEDENGHDEDKQEDSQKKKEKRRRFEGADNADSKDADVKVEVKEESNGEMIAANNGDFRDFTPMTSKNVRTMAPSLLDPTKVSSIFTTNENKGSIAGSHEVPGKPSTDGATSFAGKTASLSLDALAKAKKALQMKKEIAEKLKKIPLLSKSSSTAVDSSLVSDKSSNIEVKPLSAESSAKPTVSGVATAVGVVSVPNYEAVKRAQELAAKMGFRQDPQFAPLINLFPGQPGAEIVLPQKPTKVPVLRLDALGREIDEHGNVVNIAKPSNLSTLKVNINKQKKDAFQILKPELDADPETNPHFDAHMGVNKSKLLRPKRMAFQFVEEGKWSKEAEILKLKSQFGAARAKEQKAKQAQLAKAKAVPDINPNLIEVSERIITKEKPKDTIPESEWWDLPLLRDGTYGEVIDGSLPDDKLKPDKINFYVEHPRPIEPPAEPAPPPPQPLKLTKKEQKKLRTQRRLAREKERQEMIRQGLLEPPKPKVKMSNLMKVLGSEATQDPTRLEREIRAAAVEREQAHVDRNIARKLTPAERREKKERKLFEDTSTLETIVSVYKINDLSHKQTRFKVDVNAQENRLTGCVVISDGITVVVVEGGSKSIKRYGKLMLNRINWAAAVNDGEEEEDDREDKPPNKCLLVWQGSVAKQSFNRFNVHECITEAAARKVFSDAGVGHYWDLAVNFSDDQI
ncbi:hypothetical protein MLD38_038118 [Melastoma candidum]|uniref:Uncharacterized protein n=1 Tax=Melastoma candidum TaxID=119954 RepID=A0ACB9KY01_9MYRT|nr:hypothetical protein MLD38_038118 [Melastoma candidum]